MRKLRRLRLFSARENIIVFGNIVVCHAYLSVIQLKWFRPFNVSACLRESTFNEVEIHMYTLHGRSQGGCWSAFHTALYFIRFIVLPSRLISLEA